jgi:type I restriction enzyme, S subunit
VSEWETAKLEDLCEYITVGYVGSMAKHYVETGVPLLRSQNIKPFSLDLTQLKHVPEEFHQKIKKSALSAGDVAIVRTGYPGTACVIPESLGIANCADLVIVRTGKNLNPHFLASLFNSSWGRSSVSGRLVGVAQQHFNVSAAKSMEISYPPLETQRKIASVLSAYDDLIETNTKRIKALEESAQALYREWFVEFRFPRHEDVPMDGEIPQGWEVVKLGDIAEMKYGTMPKKNKRQDTGYPIFSGYGIVGYFPEYHYEESKIVVVARGVGGTGNIVMSPPFAYITNLAIVLHTLNDDISQEYLYHRLAYTTLWGLRTGSAQAQITISHLNEYTLLKPSFEIQSLFSDEIVLIDNQIANLNSQNRKLREAHDGLLPRLVSGEVDVSELDVR